MMTMPDAEDYSAQIVLRVNSRRAAELLAKAIRDTMMNGKPARQFSTADATRVLQSMYCMPELRVNDEVTE